MLRNLLTGRRFVRGGRDWNDNEHIIWKVRMIWQEQKLRETPGTETVSITQIHLISNLVSEWLLCRVFFSFFSPSQCTNTNIKIHVRLEQFYFKMNFCFNAFAIFKWNNRFFSFQSNKSYNDGAGCLKYRSLYFKASYKTAPLSWLEGIVSFRSVGVSVAVVTRPHNVFQCSLFSLWVLLSSWCFVNDRPFLSETLHTLS